VRRLRGGGLCFSPFQDLTKSTVVKPWADDAPSWRIAVNGLNLEGYCKNDSCKAYDKIRVIVQWGYRDFDFFKDEHKSKCPLCDKYVAPITCGFNNTFWKYEGFKKVAGEPPKEVKCDWIFANNDGYTTFEGEELVSWMNLVVKVKKP